MNWSYWEILLATVHSGIPHFYDCNCDIWKTKVREHEFGFEKLKLTFRIIGYDFFMCVSSFTPSLAFIFSLQYPIEKHSISVENI